MSSQCPEEHRSDSIVLQPTKPEENPCREEERTERNEPEILSSSTYALEELSADASLDDKASIRPVEGCNDFMEEHQQPVLKDDNGCERLKRHRTEVAGQAWIPDIWGQEDLLMGWVDCSSLDSSSMLGKIMLARASLVNEGKWPNKSRFQDKCWNLYFASKFPFFLSHWRTEILMASFSNHIEGQRICVFPP